MRTNQSTNSVDECAEILELIPDYAFGLTDGQETQFVEANLTGCPEASARLDDYRVLQASMRADVQQIEPPPHIGERLLVALATPEPAASVPRKPRRVVLRVSWLVAAAAALALVATNIYWFSRMNDLSRRQDELMALLNPEADDAFVLTSTDALRWVRLADEQPESEAAAFMMWNGESDTGLLYARAFPELDPGYKYHVWLTRDGERTFVGILQVDTAGDGALLFHSPEPIDNFGWAWVTAESEEEGSDFTTIVGGELS